MPAQLDILISWNITREWTLFLDRDGVINRRIIGGYVVVPDQFEFLPNVFEALNLASSIFDKIIVVTNQQGVGKKLMTEQDLEVIHSYMIDKIEQHGGKITKIYYCTHLVEEQSLYRKPEPGMAYRAKKDFRDIQFSRSIMVGDTKEDMQFARNAKMKAVFIGNPHEIELSRHLYDLYYPDLYSFVKEVKWAVKR
ncbi:MAG: HAD-IIIA family hydrolase [Bacteroidales bacterium]|nr:HAD-IIIA family hydrolase [Bacteroidales bacterium]